jgi:hypothetical protein
MSLLGVVVFGIFGDFLAFLAIFEGLVMAVVSGVGRVCY